MSRVDNGEVLALVALLRHTEARKSWRAVVNEVRELGALGVLHREHPQTLLDPDPVVALLEAAQRDLRAWSEVARVLTLFDDDFPPQLREVHDVPAVLFARGRLAARGETEQGACIVGSRKASPEALRFAGAVATALVRRGTAVVSGLAEGIDTAAHRAALEAGGRTVAVIGTGIDQVFPAVNKDLQQSIEREGLVLSQFWPGSGPTRSSFPMRNATMSAYGMCTLIVAAGEQSGARIQARQAVAHGRPLILTRSVATSTEWGRELARSAYDVQVIGDVDAAISAIDGVLQRPRRLDDLLADLAK
ncbi:DNA-processing protein DprA [Kribbella ginsengisoli]|uniref:Smf/DprA SLOG domain-containing protein n=1 Tax=Kribbella ginsengisoli TaxID=363865 RepID=A0ABP6Z9N3_9ACTN